LYIIKIKGKAKIPDYVQLRDENFTLIAYFRTDRPERALEKCGLTPHINYIFDVIKNIDFGKIQKLDLDNYGR
jgi:hypothetical protein